MSNHKKHIFFLRFIKYTTRKELRDAGVGGNVEFVGELFSSNCLLPYYQTGRAFCGLLSVPIRITSWCQQDKAATFHVILPIDIVRGRLKQQATDIIRSAAREIASRVNLPRLSGLPGLLVGTPPDTEPGNPDPPGNG